MVDWYRFAINEQFDKILLGRLLPANMKPSGLFCLSGLVYGFV
jgi:hypothetical protein